MRSDLSLRRAALLASAGARPRASYFRLLQIDQYLGGLVEDVVVGLVGLSDRAFGELIEEAFAPAPVSAARLNATFEEGPNGQLTFRCVADWIDADLGMRAPPSARRGVRQCAAQPHDARSGALCGARRRARPRPPRLARSGRRPRR